MIAAPCQRWRARRDTYRPAGEPIRTLDYEVAALDGDAEAKAFIVAHHYSRTYPAARARFGLFRRGTLVGVAVFSVPITPRALAMFPRPEEAIELGRFVLLDDVPANGETWFLARAFELLRGDFAGVAALSDPVPRQDVSGRLVMPGHVGTIYQAFNGVYLGRATPRTLHVLPDGSVFSARAAQKVRAGERGWRYAVAQLVAAGAAPLAANDDPATWLRGQLPRVTRRLRHPGNHRYAWALDRALRRHLGPGLAFPKRAA